MPKLTVNGKTTDVSNGKRMVLAIEDSGVNIGHRYGGNARCTTCRIRFLEGEPQQMTRAEYEILRDRDILREFRLSCQIVCDHDMSVEPQMTLESQGWSDTGPAPQPNVMPEAKWFPIEEMKQE